MRGIISFEQKGNLSKTYKFLNKAKRGVRSLSLDRFGRDGVRALASATPMDSGETAASWFYTIQKTGDTVTISWNNSHVNKGVNIAVILQYGHATRNGGWVEGRDYINPTIQPIFDKIAKDAWEEVAGR